jgi:hypothetical protein
VKGPRAGLAVYDGGMIYLGFAAAVVTSWVGHGLHPRTPVTWEPGACMTVVDRSVEPVLSLAYTIEYEDTMVEPGEVPDSRRHQFLALCHDYPQRFEAPPNWLSQADVDAAAVFALVEPESVVAGDILEMSPKWEGCWTRITADDERRPITYEAAKEPVLWDTTGLPVGPQVVYGYTWEPLFNIWSRRPGVVQVVDDLDLAASPPALAVSTEQVVEYYVEDAPPMIEGCVRAMEGATLTGYVGAGPVEALSWTVFAEAVAVTGEGFALPLVVPPELLGVELAIRVEVVDPLGRDAVAYMRDVAVLVEDLPDNPAPEPMGSESSGGGEDSSGDVTTDMNETCCGCDASAGPPGWGLLALVLLGRGRVSRGRTRPVRSC